MTTMAQQAAAPGRGAITRLLEVMREGDPGAGEEPLSHVYQELHALAASKMRYEPPGQTLQPTALVHEVWVRLLEGNGQHFHDRAYFFAAAGEAMRRILVENARRKKRLKRGGNLEKTDLEQVDLQPACQRAWQRHREIQLEEAYGVRQIQWQGVFYITNRALAASERVKAVEFLTLAANYDYGPSQYILGYCYKNGIGAATNRVLAWKWLTLAANKGSENARGLLNQLQNEMSAEETAEAQRLVHEFAPTRQKVR